MYDVIIIGSGPAGLSAAIYAKRAALDTLVIEKSPLSGGQILNTYEVDNYPGLPKISGMELGQKMREHANQQQVSFVTESVKEIISEDDVKKVVTNKNTYETKTVILAMGASHRALGVPGEEELCGMGVSYCATCDGAFFKNRIVAVVGGGDVALEDALFLARGCKQVYLIHRRDEFRGAKILQEQVRNTENITLCMDSVVEKIEGEDSVEKILTINKKTQEKKELEVQGVFIAVGILPNTDEIQGLPTRDEAGYIVAGEDGVTNLPGVFVAGDCRTKQLRQVITATADGANAVTSVEKYLFKM
ncbi:MAG: thioredoxin-disulfide reductase [Lachnospiraceae bacterium]|nr:thioredoxin-disulfide reductase [Lachnospiraceae bacterium]MDD6192870.1 thioredoxin-disulfide reductase [Lachnospiraceae bacterium]MDY4792948.1 thioredoxin-disulfide reductase [Pararoseburia sp.]